MAIHATPGQSRVVFKGRPLWRSTLRQVRARLFAGKVLTAIHAAPDQSVGVLEGEGLMVIQAPPDQSAVVYREELGSGSRYARSERGCLPGGLDRDPRHARSERGCFVGGGGLDLVQTGRTVPLLS